MTPEEQHRLQEAQNMYFTMLQAIQQHTGVAVMPHIERGALRHEDGTESFLGTPRLRFMLIPGWAESENGKETNAPSEVEGAP